MTMLFQDETADRVWRPAYSHIKMVGRVQEGRDQETIEEMHVMMEIRNPRERFVHSRRINLAFALMEVIWIMNGSDELNDLVYWNPRMKQYSDNGETLYGAYGYRLRKLHDLDQLTHAYNTLSKLPETRQVVLQVWDCVSDFPRLNGEPVSKDIPCNLMSHLLVRDDKLHWLQVMRSNDLIWGTPYNLIQWTMLQEIMAGWLGLDLGPYVHVSDSLHIYKRHWETEDVDFVTRDTPFPKNTDKFNFSYNESALCFHTLWEFSREIISDDYIPSKQYARVTVNRCKLPEPYKNIAVVLMTEVLHKERNLSDAAEFLRENCTNPAYIELQLAWMNRRK